MNYCRFSSDDFGCDVFCYVSEFGYEIYVASSRVIFDGPLPPPVSQESDIIEFVERSLKVASMVDRAWRITIRLPHAGKAYLCAEPEEAADKLEYLRDAGYRVPQYAIDALKEEAKEVRG